jgi:hypothetical protein
MCNGAYESSHVSRYIRIYECTNTNVARHVCVYVFCPCISRYIRIYTYTYMYECVYILLCTYRHSPWSIFRKHSNLACASTCIYTYVYVYTQPMEPPSQTQQPRAPVVAVPINVRMYMYAYFACLHIHMYGIHMHIHVYLPSPWNKRGEIRPFLLLVVVDASVYMSTYMADTTSKSTSRGSTYQCKHISMYVSVHV